MAKHFITFACGCEERVQLPGAHAARDREMARLAGRKCEQCFRADAAAAGARAASEAAAAGLPELIGTAAQVAWAASIRAARLPMLATMRANLGRAPEDRRAAVEAAIAAVEGERSAAYWIEGRADSPADLVRRAHKAAAAHS